jgi:Tfp pilus assembly protein PilN
MATRQINLLPPERRYALKKSLVWKKLVDFSNKLELTLWFLSFVGIILMLSLWILSVAAASTTVKELEMEVEEYREIRREVAQQKALLEQVHGVAKDRMVWSDVLNEFVNVVPSGIIIEFLSGNMMSGNNENMEANLSLKGQAVTRNVLQAFIKRLEELEVTTKIDSPASNLLDRDRPEFELKLQIKPVVSKSPTKP